ncbi:MAG: SdpI family protein [Anaerolineales bacterium]
MSTRTTIFATIFMIAFVLAFSVSVYDRLPEQMASHWNESGQVDGYMSRFWGAFMMPVLVTAMLGLFLLIPNIDPLKANIAKFREQFNTFITLIVAFMVYVHILTMIWNLGYDQFNMGTAMIPALGLLFIFAGLMMRKAKRNFFIGIRTPWTLSSDRVWDETHRIGASLFIASGILAMLGVFFADYAIWLVLVPVLGSTLFLLVYSYVLYQRETKG